MSETLSRSQVIEQPEIDRVTAEAAASYGAYGNAEHDYKSKYIQGLGEQAVALAMKKEAGELTDRMQESQSSVLLPAVMGLEKEAKAHDNKFGELLLESWEDGITAEEQWIKGGELFKANPTAYHEAALHSAAENGVIIDTNPKKLIKAAKDGLVDSSNTREYEDHIKLTGRLEKINRGEDGLQDRPYNGKHERTLRNHKELTQEKLKMTNRSAEFRMEHEGDVLHDLALQYAEDAGVKINKG